MKAGVMSTGPRIRSRSKNSLRRARKGRRAVSGDGKGSDRHGAVIPP